jgi:D-glycerate 3-kinase
LPQLDAEGGGSGKTPPPAIGGYPRARGRPGRVRAGRSGFLAAASLLTAGPARGKVGDLMKRVARDRQAFATFLGLGIRALVASAPPARRPVIVGLSAPQGAGKTTVTTALCRIAREAGLRALGLSIDDFYLARAEQVALSRRQAGNPFLAQRGFPGTHDVALGAEVLAALRGLRPGEEIALPSYDRSADQGHGDRRPESAWPRATGPLDFILLEGWMLGFVPLDPGAIAVPQLGPVNELLAGYAVWTAFLDALIWIEAEDCRYVVDWRAEAEAEARAAGRGGMSDAEVRAFAARFLVAYELYLPTMRLAPPVAGPLLRVTIGRDRLPLAL